MSTAAVFKVWLDDWRGSLSVRTMTFAERGAYFELLTWCWSFQGEGLPTDDDELASLAGRPVEEWNAVKGRVLEHFETRDGRLHNPKVAKLIEREKGYRKRSRAGNESRWYPKQRPKSVPKGVPKSSSSFFSSSSSSSSSPTGEDVPSPSVMDVDRGRSTRQRHDKIDWSAALQRWKLLASEHGLPGAEKLNTARKAKLRQRLREHPDFWKRVSEKLSTRSGWARERRFPSLDQVLQQSTCQKLLEGFYDERKPRLHDCEIKEDG